MVDASSPEPSSHFYLNVCHKVIQTGDAADCPVNAAICAIGESFQNMNVIVMFHLKNIVDIVISD